MTLHISLAAEKLGSIAGFPITNSLLTTWVVMALLTLFSLKATWKMRLIPTGFQLFAEIVVGGLYDFFSSVVGIHIKKFFPFIATLFIYILVANWVGLLPGVGTIGFFHAPKKEVQVRELAIPNLPKALDTEIKYGTPEVVLESEGLETNAEVAKEGEKEPAFTPLFRAATADLNMTIALAIVSIIAMQYFGFKTLGMHYSGRFVSFKDPITFAVGLLEIMSDLSKVLSFAFRLFGNIFAGEVLLAVIAFIMPFIVPLPFLAMELFVGIIQALVFSMLSAAFFSMAVSHEGGSEHKGVVPHGA